MLITIIKDVSRGPGGGDDGRGTARNQSRYTEKERKNMPLHAHLCLIDP